MRIENIISKQDGLNLELAITDCKNPRGIVQISHGMAEHKERYFGFMEYLNKRGYICVIHDHRGHGHSVKSKRDYGYFYTEDIQCIVDDLFQVSEYVHVLYPNLDITLFSHSMGTLVARCYLKKYDTYIKNVILCGPPTQNLAARFGLVLAKILKPFYTYNKENKFLNKITFSNYGKGYEWLSTNPNNVKAYEEDELCGYLFTTNGFINLFQLMIAAFDKKDWHVQNTNLHMFLMAGALDPVIQNADKFYDLVYFLKSLGYKDVSYKLYPGLKHEILNENEKESIYEDIYVFIEKNRES